MKLDLDRLLAVAAVVLIIILMIVCVAVVSAHGWRSIRNTFLPLECHNVLM